MIHEQTKKFSWDGIEHEHIEKTTDWYWGLGIILVTGIIISFASKNYLLIILLLLGGIMLAFYANDKPEPVTVEISERGIKLNQDLYTYHSIESFWMYRDHQDKDQLAIVTGRNILPKRIITLPDTLDHLEIRNFLLEHVDEKEIKPHLIDIIIQGFGI